MAFLDRDRGLVVVRIVFDGPARSGKTTTLRALARGLGARIFSGEEAEGRTLYFDWLDYTGGRFEGYPIRCQAVSVPGQRLLRTRRDRILQSADSVVFVADTTREGLEASGRMLASLRADLRGAGAPRPGVVVQANKRDVPGAVTAREVRRVLASDDGVAVVDTIASDGAGLREAFVLAVRLALDRVRALMRTGTLPEASSEMDSSDALLDDLRERERAAGGDEGAAVPSPSAAAIAQVLRGETDGAAMDAVPPPSDESGARPVAPDRPTLPAADIPGGTIWPPVGGRILLHEAVLEDPLLERLPDGSWTAVAGGRMRLHADPEDVFSDPEAARRSLVEWARWHTVALPRLSPHRCILSAQAGPGTWRLWQIVRRERTMRAALDQVLSRASPPDVAHGLLELARSFEEGAASLAPLGLRASLDTLGFVESGLVHVGLTPAACAPRPSSADVDRTPAEQLRSEFGPVIARASADPALQVPRVLHHLAATAGTGRHAGTGELLAAMLTGQ